MASEQTVVECRVEMTVSRGVLRIAGTVIGGTLGFLIMLNYSLAANPYALMASPPAQALYLSGSFQGQQHVSGHTAWPATKQHPT